MELYRKKQDYSQYDDYKLACMDLEIILTQKCNLSCEHCMRGDCMGKEISEEVIDSLFKKVIYIDNLSLGGGEITLVPEKIRMLAQKLKEHKIIVHHANFTTNGTVVSEEVLNALSEIRAYVESCEEKPHLFTVPKAEQNIPLYACFSFDDYHLNQIIKHGITIEELFKNIAKYQQCFGDEAIQCRLECDMDFYDEGRAKLLPASEHKVSMQKVLSEPYPFIDYESHKFLLLGNVPCVTCEGNFVPVNISFESEKALSFGNVVTDSISQILSNMNAVKTDNKGYDRAREKLYKAMTAPKHLQKQYKPMLSEKHRIFFQNLAIVLQEMQ